MPLLVRQIVPVGQIVPFLRQIVPVGQIVPFWVRQIVPVGQIVPFLVLKSRQIVLRQIVPVGQIVPQHALTRATKPLITSLTLHYTVNILSTLGTWHARIQGGGQGGLAPPPSPQNIAPPISEARAKRALAPPPRGPRGPCPPPLQNPGSAYAWIRGFLIRTSHTCFCRIKDPKTLFASVTLSRFPFPRVARGPTTASRHRLPSPLPVTSVCCVDSAPLLHGCSPYSSEIGLFHIPTC